LALVLVPVAVVSVTMVGAGCSKERRAVGEIRKAFEAHEYRETVALCRHAIRRGVDDAKVYYYYGASLVSLGRDFEGFRHLGEAARREPDLTTTIGTFLFKSGDLSFQKRRRSQAAKRMQKAVEVDPSLELGAYLYLVADEYFTDKEYEKATQFYARAIEAHPDTTVVEQAYFNLAESYAEIEAPGKARESLEQLLELRPRGSLATQARWRLANLMYEQGEKHFLLGNYQEVVEVIGELLRRTRNPGLVQKSRFLLGETYERLGEFRKAYRQYREIIEEDRGASGRIVERAKAKMATLREAGLY
jgi:tetratricopeptide (TPR) repeat protein